jgi:hypothetical protein
VDTAASPIEVPRELFATSKWQEVVREDLLTGKRTSVAIGQVCSRHAYSATRGLIVGVAPREGDTAIAIIGRKFSEKSPSRFVENAYKPRPRAAFPAALRAGGRCAPAGSVRAVAGRSKAFVGERGRRGWTRCPVAQAFRVVATLG